MKRIYTFLIGLTLIVDCFADEQRLQLKFESNNGKYSIGYKNKKWVLTDKKGSVKYSIQDHGFGSMTIFVSDNGQNIVVIDDFMEGHNIGSRNAIWFYKFGKLVKSHRLNELISDTCNVSKSIWHTGWCIENYGFVDNQEHYTVSTYELTDFVFDLASGQIITKNKPEGFDSESLIVFGEFRKGEEDHAVMKIKRYMAGKGQPDDLVKFKTTYYGVGLWREVLMIKNGIDMTPDKYRCKIFLSECNNER